ncbi:MAG: 4Fe-4S binding protein [Deltaproteobacteria bacterium]|nr:4Fe-4S binding protein [Deltaproteobacteria bacterium]
MKAKLLAEREKDSKGEPEKKKSALFGFRQKVQWGVFVLTIAIGIQFFIYVYQASQGGQITVLRPPGVEGFLPIGALMGWKLFILTGLWDTVHPAAMVILGYAALISVLLRKSFCGWFCPAGSLSEMLWKLGRRLFGENFIVPLWLDIPLRSVKYLLLGFFLWVIIRMGSDEIHMFLQSPYYKLSDVKMLFFFTRISVTTLVVFIILVLLSIPIRNFWCRYLCPYGALMGLLALVSPTRIQRNPGSCTDCKRCTKACPYHLPVDRKLNVRSAECNGCMDCTLCCPAKDTLEMKTKGMGKRSWSVVILGTVISVTEHELIFRLKEIDSPKYLHPGIRGR